MPTMQGMRLADEPARHTRQIERDTKTFDRIRNGVRLFCIDKRLAANDKDRPLSLGDSPRSDTRCAGHYVHSPV